MNAFQIRNYSPFYGNGIHVLLQRGNDISKYIYMVTGLYIGVLFL